MGTTFADLFEEALDERKELDPKFGLRTLARQLADNDKEQAEIIRRRLNKYRRPKDGGSAAIKPTEGTRREIEHALGLKVDSLKPAAEDPKEAAAQKVSIDLMDQLLDALADRLAAKQRPVTA